MGTQLHQVLTFTAIAPGGQQSQPHNINWNGRAVIPDRIFPMIGAGEFSVVAVTDDEMTIQNDGDDPADFVFWLESLYSPLRAFGREPATQGQLFLTPLPFVAAGGSSNPGSLQVFRYTVTGAEPDLSDFMVPLPAARSTDVYRVVGTLAGAAALVVFDLPDLLAGDRTTTHFRIIGSDDFTALDQIDFVVSDVIA